MDRISLPIPVPPNTAGEPLNGDDYQGTNAMTTKKILCLLFALSFSCTASAEEPPAEVMLMGTFHFASPGLDKVKTQHIDVTTDENQAYLESLRGALPDSSRPPCCSRSIRQMKS